MRAQHWLDDLIAAIRTFGDERGLTPVVRITLVDGTSRVVQNATAGPSDDLLTFSLYPEADEIVANLIAVEQRDGGVEHFTREAVVVDPDRVMKIELLSEAPGRRRDIGFQATPEDG